MSPSKLLTSETNTDAKAAGRPQDLYPFHREMEMLLHRIERDEELTHFSMTKACKTFNCCLADTAIHKEQERLVQSPDLMC